MTRPGGEAAAGRRGPLGRWLALALVVVALDQASKWAILGRFEYGERLNLVPGWFDFTLVYNTGAAFSFLADAAGWQRWFFTALALVASGVIVFLLRRHGENQVVVNAVAAHHEDVPAESVYAILAAAADAISAARPGARAETSAIYVKRLEQLEAIANGMPGVEKSYAIQAGREVRVLVQSDKVDDAGAMHRAREISKKIEQELQYPGQIRVTVIRETRFVEYAR